MLLLPQGTEGPRAANPIGGGPDRCAARGIRLNGLAIPRLAHLHVGDELDVAGTRFAVSYRHRPHRGAPPADLAGRPCGVCGVALEESTQVVLCAGCGCAVHDEDEVPGRDAEPLRCLSLCGARCPECQERLDRPEGLLFEPRDD